MALDLVYMEELMHDNYHIATLEESKNSLFSTSLERDGTEERVFKTEVLVFEPIWSNVSMLSPTTHCTPTFQSTIEPGYQRTKYILDICIVPVVCLLGIAGNIVSFIVLRNKTMSRSTTSMLLRSLAIMDTLYLLSCLLFQFFKGIYYYVITGETWFDWFPYIEPYVWYFANSAQMGVVWITVLVSMDRYFAICTKLLRGKILESRMRAPLGILVTVLATLSFNVPVFFDLKIIMRTQSCNNFTRPEATISDHFSSKTYQLVYKTVVCFLARSFLPFVLLLFCNFKLVQTIKISSAISRSQIHHSGRRNTKYFTNVLITVVAIFLMCAIPDFIFRILRTIHYFWPESGISWKFLAYLGTFANFLFTINSAVNICIYSLTGSNFRAALKHMCSSEAESNTQICLRNTDKGTSLPSRFKLFKSSSRSTNGQLTTSV